MAVGAAARFGGTGPVRPGGRQGPHQRTQQKKFDMKPFFTYEFTLQRVADALEKLAAGSLLIGIYQGSVKAYSIGTIFLLMSIGLSFYKDLKRRI
jgi:hypothetical protein